MSISCLDAFYSKQNGAISWEEYIHVLLARCVGIKHEDDNVDGSHSELRRIDPFGHSIWLWSKRIDASSFRDINSLEAVFEAYRYNTLDEVKTMFALLDRPDTVSVRGVKASLAQLACQERRADILKFCLDQGDFPINNFLVYEVEVVDAENDPETFNVIQQSRQLSRYLESEERSREQGEKEEERDENGYLLPRAAAVIFDTGGKLPVNW